jgi:branched-chain amino acid transport system permease protein
VVTPLADAPPRPFIVATVGLALVLSEGVRIAQGAREIWLQPMMETPIVLTGGEFPVVVTQMRLTIVAAALIILPLILWFMRRSSFGRAWRAVADDRLMARLSGIDPLAVTAATFVLASALAAGGGTVIALSYGGTSYSIGFLIGLKALFASLIGGAGSLLGAVLGGFLIALLETGWSAYFGSSDRDIVVLVVITLLFILRPNGLLGRGQALEEGRIPRLS